MKKLSVLALAVLVGILVMAENVTVSWTVKKAVVTVTLTDKGIDVTSNFNISLSWGPLSASADNQKGVKVAFSWGFHDGAANLNSMEFDGEKVYLGYFTSGYTFGNDIYKKAFGGDTLKFKLKAFEALTVVYADKTESEVGPNLFDDAVAVEYTGSMGMFDAAFKALFYDSDATENSFTSDWAAVAKLTGKEALEKLKVNLAADSANTWGVKVEYEKSLELGTLSITLKPCFKYDDGSGWLGQKAKVDTTVKTSFGPVSVELNTVPVYDIAASAFSASLKAKASISMGKVSADTTFSMTDIVNTPDVWSLEANASANLTDALTIGGNFTTNNTGTTTWKGYVEYQIESNLKAYAEYKHDNTWLAEVSYSF